MKVKKLNWKGKESQRLIEAFLSLKSNQDAENFLRDLMTEKEILEFTNRLKTAEMLSANITYTDIEKETGFSSTTIARVSKWLNGKLGGYRSVINNLSHHHKTKNLRKNLS